MRKKLLEEKVYRILTQSNKINFQFNTKFCRFTKIIPYLYLLVNIRDPDLTLEINLKEQELELLGYGLSEEFLRLTIEENFLSQLEQYCKKS